MYNNAENEITLLYHSGKHDDKKARGYLEPVQGYSIKLLDLAKENISETQIAEVADMMNVGIEELLDDTYEGHPGVKNDGLKKMERNELLIVMRNDPKLISTPILIIGKKAYKFGTGYDLIKGMSMGVSGIKSANREEQRGVDADRKHG
jgi:arsenate reductase-like glutaredoxin family protein